MKSTTFAIASLLASVAIAQPHRQHKHQAKHAKRDVVLVTDWVSVTETVGYTTTVWVEAGDSPATEAPASSSASSSTASVASSAASVSSSATAVAAQFHEAPASSSSSVYVAPAPSPSSSSVYVAPAPSSTYVAPAPSVAQAVSVAEVQTPTSVYVAPTTTAAPVYTAPTTTSAAAQPTTSAASSSGGSTGGCSAGSPCEGDFTYYEAGLGACGITNDGSTDKIVALSHLLMGTQSNGNPYCGKTITVEYKGKTTTATVTDKCMGCAIDAIDLSNAAYEELADLSLGRDTATCRQSTSTSFIFTAGGEQAGIDRISKSHVMGVPGAQNNLA
ncbi:Allergen Asp f [Lachnellula suecica]|uniref:Allergen Asp f n=1 Tax=Lachnellula suecica TaxID=602035 RepID=A0A8T9BQV9_9HELO|nr:Allergen Asp f [Lachnellula suecica]